VPVTITYTCDLDPVTGIQMYVGSSKTVTMPWSASAGDGSHCSAYSNTLPAQTYLSWAASSRQLTILSANRNEFQGVTTQRIQQTPP
jgi:hypothetical protein